MTDKKNKKTSKKKKETSEPTSAKALKKENPMANVTKVLSLDDLGKMGFATLFSTMKRCLETNFVRTPTGLALQIHGIRGARMKLQNSLLLVHGLVNDRVVVNLAKEKEAFTKITEEDMNDLVKIEEALKALQAEKTKVKFEVI